ncbi:hypothetical protein [Novosphingobium cyanobacteriorum]|uniref:DUF2889 domain-containing protein n=1 Tax=Novosphingobium cyanobacteriorum TaxID=3024215 RepID=A0ABT6CCX1_9SPHN|nr:hypothetical protein [Novosphingobium cyanobacteriorum]MDF8331662.1 hypothetical protein [Novosphingobium cyanobacteriorum]
MSAPELHSNYPANPAFGTGVFRRRIRLDGRAGVVVVQLDDNCHAMWLRLEHDGARVKDVVGDLTRFPTTGCPSAPAGLRVLKDKPLNAPQAALYSGGGPVGTCTHMFDLAVLAMAHAQRDPGLRTWDVIVPDMVDGITTASVELDGRPLHRWRVEERLVIAPGLEADPQPLFHKFRPWAERHFSGDALEAALVLRMGLFVSRARFYITDAREIPLTEMAMREGSCHAYSRPQIESSHVLLGTVRDFSQQLEEAPLPEAALHGSAR